MRRQCITRCTMRHMHLWCIAVFQGRVLRLRNAYLPCVCNRRLLAEVLAFCWCHAGSSVQAHTYPCRFCGQVETRAGPRSGAGRQGAAWDFEICRTWSLRPSATQHHEQSHCSRSRALILCHCLQARHVQASAIEQQRPHSGLSPVVLGLPLLAATLPAYADGIEEAAAVPVTSYVVTGLFIICALALGVVTVGVLPSASCARAHKFPRMRSLFVTWLAHQLQ